MRATLAFNGLIKKIPKDSESDQDSHTRYVFVDFMLLLYDHQFSVYKKMSEKLKFLPRNMHIYVSILGGKKYFFGKFPVCIIDGWPRSKS